MSTTTTAFGPRFAEHLPDGFSRHEAEVNGTTLSYLIGGAGQPIVLLHGWPQTALSWRPVLRPLADLGYTVVAPDLRGTGQSSRAESGYDKDNQAEDVRALIDLLDLGPHLRLVGHDIGGMVAFSYARLHPSEVERLILMELAVPGFGLEEAMNVARGGRWHFGLFMTPEVPELLFEGQEKAFFTWWFAHLSADPDQFSPSDIDEVVRSYAGPASLRGGFAHYRTLLHDGNINRAWRESGGQLTMPVLAVGGERAVGTALADGVRPAAPGVASAVIPNSGHFVAEEQPDHVLAALREFLQ